MSPIVLPLSPNFGAWFPLVHHSCPARHPVRPQRNRRVCAFRNNMTLSLGGGLLTSLSCTFDLDYGPPFAHYPPHYRLFLGRVQTQGADIRRTGMNHRAWVFLYERLIREVRQRVTWRRVVVSRDWSFEESKQARRWLQLAREAKRAVIVGR